MGIDRYAQFLSVDCELARDAHDRNVVRVRAALLLERDHGAHVGSQGRERVL